MTPAQKKAFVERMARARARKGTVVSTKSAPARTEIIVAPQARQSLGPPPKAAPKSLARRVGSAAVVAAVNESQLLATGITGFGLGYLEQEGWFNDVPEPGALPIGKVGYVALATYAVNRWLIKDPGTKKIISGVTSAAVAIASHQMGKGFAIKQQAEKLLKGDAAGDLENESQAGV